MQNEQIKLVYDDLVTCSWYATMRHTKTSREQLRPRSYPTIERKAKIVQLYDVGGMIREKSMGRDGTYIAQLRKGTRK